MEFACDEVAKIAAETMHNYMMFGRLLKCEYYLYIHAHLVYTKPVNSVFHTLLLATQA